MRTPIRRNQENKKKRKKYPLEKSILIFSRLVLIADVPGTDFYRMRTVRELCTTPEYYIQQSAVGTYEYKDYRNAPLTMIDASSTVVVALLL